MCGRFTLYITAEELASHYDLRTIPATEARYNIAPSQQINIIKGTSEELTLASMRWGLIPHWAKDEKIGYKLINARAETISEKPSFRSAFKFRRCLVPASGFYEWKREGSHKQPYYFQVKDTPLFSMAGIWESWKAPDGQIIESCSIITTEANNVVSEVHDRMPVIINQDSYNHWFEGLECQDLLQPYISSGMTMYPVSERVNSPKNNGSDCIKRRELQ